MRTFFAVPIDESLRTELSRRSIELRQQIETRASWVPAANLHLTIRFLGEIDPGLTVELEDVAQDVSRQIPRFRMEIDRLGAFPRMDRPRVIWAGGSAPDAFYDLVKRVNDGLVRLGFEADTRRPTAHITLARLKGRATDQDVAALREQGVSPGELAARELVLMESTLSRRGAVYQPLFSVDLAAGG